MAVITTATLAIAYYISKRRQRLAKEKEDELNKEDEDPETKIGRETPQRSPTPNSNGKGVSTYRSYLSRAYSFISRSPTKEVPVSVLILGLAGAGKTSLMNVLSIGDAINQTSFQQILSSKTPSDSIESVTVTANLREESESPEEPNTESNNETTAAATTTEYEIEEISHPRISNGRKTPNSGGGGGASLKMFDFSGKIPVRAHWHTYFSTADAIIYVVDSSDKENLKLAGEELLSALLKHDLENSADSGAEKDGGGEGGKKDATQIILLLSNKRDVGGCVLNEELFVGMGFNDDVALEVLSRRAWSIFGCSAKSGEGLSEAMDWLAEEILKRRCPVLDGSN
ncbi:ADP-ribosylation factor-like protein 2 [Nowakowskiella sp. JEL0407]|nr:ADP-ribosylation factor-like protein 2 [Nowakowskiella sp. JEL0407]